jgi:iron complex outermembrane receptor protein
MGSVRVRESHPAFVASRVRKYALATVSAGAMFLGAHAASAQDVAQADSSTVESVQVTGTRIVRDGYSAPTPVTVIGTDAINAEAPANIADYLNSTIPAIVNSETANNSSGSLSNGLAGINAINLRSLGVNRTLILLDGHRTPASAVTGDVDINTIPQQLVQRVDVVTGGASADYGSDAVGGVVNFVLDKDYTGFKASADYGETDAGLQPSYKVDATYGGEFLGGKLHVLLSGEYVTTQAISNYDPKWNKTDYFQMQNPAYAVGNGQPFYLISSGIGASEVTPGGLILSATTTAGKTSSALTGTYFGTNASLNQLTFGQVSGPWMIGGDTKITQSNYQGTNSLAAAENRESIFGRIAYDITPDINAWLDVSVSRDKTQSFYQQDPSVGGVTIKSDNAFIPTALKTQLTTLGLASFTEGTTNSGFPEAGSLNGREANRILGGFDGNTNVFDTDWKWDLSGQISWIDDHEEITNAWNNAKLALAQDAVVAPAGNAAGIAAGTIVCRDTLTNPNDGCSPISRIGLNGGLQSPAAFQQGLNYVLGNPFRNERLSEQDYAFNVSGSPFSDWAGPISVASGAEWRLESVNGFVPSQYNSGWLYGNYLVNKGHYSVAETYLETVVPIIQGMDFNGAIRYAAYSTSGGVNTWKMGLTYQPVDDIKFRAVYSHDIRAPDLAELFAAGTARTNTVNVNTPGGATSSQGFVQDQTGNVNLSPEAANNLEVGTVFTPSFIPGLTASVDYFNITIAHEIGSLTAQNVADLCYLQGIQSQCSNITYNNGTTSTPTFNAAAGGINTILLVPFNFAKQKNEGIDFDITYQMPLEDMNWFGTIPGDMTIHALATDYMRDYTNDGVNPPADVAGVNASGGVPSWIYRVSATYHTDPWTFFVMARGLSSGTYSNNYVVCQTNCPLYSLARPTANLNSIPGAFYMDLSTTYDFKVDNVAASAYLSIKNIFDTNPALVGNGPSGNNIPAYVQTNRNLYDYLGRVYRIGFRFEM